MLFEQNKSEKINIKGKKKLPISAVISYLLVAAVLTTAVSFSRYSTSISGEDSARVARYVLEVNEAANTDDFSLDLRDISAPGDTAEIVFVVTNQNEYGLCEVGQKYDISYSTTGNLPLQMDLEGRPTDNKGNPYPGAVYEEFDNGNPSQSGTFPAAEKAIHTYTLKITWPAYENNLKYADEIDQITIAVKAQQNESN